MIRENLKTDDYITIPRLKKFCKDNSLGSFSIKEEGLARIEEFSNASNENQIIVNAWLDEVAKEGIKYSYIKKITRPDELLKSELFWREFIKTEFVDRRSERINNAIYSNNLSIQFIQYKLDDAGVEKVFVNLGFFVYEIKKNTDGTLIADKIIYPIFVEINTAKDIIEIRLKSKSNLRRILRENGPFEERIGDKVTVEDAALEVFRFIKNKLNFEEIPFDESKTKFFKSYYMLLESLTFTPKVIVDKIQSKVCDANSFAKKMFNELNLNSVQYLKMASEDLVIWLEKYISLSEINQKIFTEDREGYPVKLIATDLDDTRIEETSAKKDPLQTKASYFDHKKILKRDKLCDGMSLAFKRLDTKYYGNVPFLVIMKYKKGFGIVNFPEYVEEGDIQNVLSRIIENL